jgi:ABC-type spermidine/putrescine transport system permease subunit II
LPPATLQHFEDAIDRPYFWRTVGNSLIIVGVVVALSLAIAFLSALALAKFRFYGRRAFIVTIIAVQMVPLTALIIPLSIMLGRAGYANTLIGVIVTYLAFVLPFCVWTLRGFVLGVPRELEEAAMVDGSTRFGAFVRILLPLVAPGFVATSIFAFIQVWNEFIIAYVLLRDPEKQTLAVWLAGGKRVGGVLDTSLRGRLQRLLNLRRELAGPSGIEYGWRYVDWDSSGNAQLLQLFDYPDTGVEVALLFDRRPPSQEVVAGCWLQVQVAAGQVGMTVAKVRPEVVREVSEPDWAALARQAATAQTLPELLPAIGCTSHTPYELTRGRLLAVSTRSEWKEAGAQLRRQVEDYLLGLES